VALTRSIADLICERKSHIVNVGEAGGSMAFRYYSGLLSPEFCLLRTLRCLRVRGGLGGETEFAVASYSLANIIIALLVRVS
jgi:hypothetical protein